jgi:hypothetical protein
MVLNPTKHRGLILLWMKLELPMEYRTPYWRNHQWQTATYRTGAWIEKLSTEEDPYPRYEFRLRPLDATDHTNP